MQIEAQNLTVALGGKAILQGIDLSLRPGELVGLIGPNGAGKTTLLKALADLLAPDTGQVLYEGQTAHAFGRGELARRIAFLAQGGSVHWQMRVEALVALGRLPHRRPFADSAVTDRDAIARAMAAADITQFRGRTIDTLSGGERMRVLLARALAVEAAMLLADEPLAALDPLHQLEVMSLLRASVTPQTGVVVILHDLTLAGRFCDRLVLIDRGRVVADGPPATVLSDTNIADVFGVTTARGQQAGQGFVLPWQPLPPTREHEAGAKTA
ncbi:ABC transporter ATP-binding protein [Bosea sp. 124]|uniref:ABC transporter ATP-binding protein n=1 Tax=Bosea sp. 124 TaxID=2135642 RepID=UPI000D3D23DC|nr:ABC transporter ATP-binding protein [Bosea sp. 124]PTM39788.1 iron complex transport system ATP-binding protein [Bosea sp. 124]